MAMRPRLFAVCFFYLGETEKRYVCAKHFPSHPLAFDSISRPSYTVLKICFQYSVVSQKRNKSPVPNKHPPLRFER